MLYILQLAIIVRYYIDYIVKYYIFNPITNGLKLDKELDTSCKSILFFKNLDKFLDF